MRIGTDRRNQETRQPNFSLKILLQGALLLTIAAFIPGTGRAACDANSFHGITPLKNDRPAFVHIGDTVTVTGRLKNNADECGDSWVATNAFIIVFSSSVPAGCAMTTVPVTIPGVSNVV